MDINEYFKNFQATLGDKKIKINENSPIRHIISEGLANNGKEFENTTTLMADGIANTLTYYKDVVLVSLRNSIKEINENASTRFDGKFFKIPSIIFTDLPDFAYENIENKTIYDSTLTELLENSGSISMDKNFDYLESFLASGLFSSEEILYIRNISGETLKRIFDEYFSDLSLANDNFNNLYAKKRFTTENYEDPYILYLASRWLINNVQETSNMSLNTYTDSLNRVEAITMTVILKRHKLNEVFTANGTVLTDVNENNMFINRINYNTYIANDGDINALIGFVKNQGTKISLEKLTNEKEKYLSLYNTWVALETKKRDVSAHDIYKIIYAIHFEKMLKNRTFKYVKENPFEELESKLDKYSNTEITNVEYVVKDIYYDILYVDLNPRSFFEDVDTYLAKNDIKMDQALLLATIGLIVKTVMIGIETE